MSESEPNLVNQPISVVVQTTFHVIEWKNCLKILKRVYTNATILIQYVMRLQNVSQKLLNWRKNLT